LADDADKVLRAVKTAFADATKGSLTDKDVEVAKAQLTANYLMFVENGANVLEDIGTQAAILGSAMSVEEGLKMINGVTAADVNRVRG
jgi:predicted Zn-dependent peptidase